MKQMIILLLLLGIASPGLAVEVAGVDLAPQIQVAGETLHLNGYGIRRKFFFKIYVGSLYTAHKVNSTEQALAAKGGKLIRMNFLYHKVAKQKIVDAFAEGFAKNSPSFSSSKEAKTFLGWFDSDFVRKDQVDLLMAGDGTVSASQNGRPLGSLTSPALARAVLLIYLGDKPADEDMKQGMLRQD